MEEEVIKLQKCLQDKDEQRVCQEINFSLTYIVTQAKCSSLIICFLIIYSTIMSWMILEHICHLLKLQEKQVLHPNEPSTCLFCEICEQASCQWVFDASPIPATDLGKAQ
ncbi:hypothetical protein ZEAMMB73_Zm00001d007401 [Zea mays]|uniref:Uncharacterized protein n=1 Tax=Zea mays TaxID=4577 RepID=A0A1D6F616_MAIZE|nr:hypothetical protein ZEAMMB73_Zm00001d007401 [Zea mays]